MNFIRRKLYRLLLRILKVDKDFLGRDRENFGTSAYSRRSPLLLTVLNLQELSRFLSAPKLSIEMKRAIKSTKNSKIGKTALLLGNGPSLNRLQIKNVLKDSPDIWVVNDFYKTEVAKHLQVSFYVLSDADHLNPLDLIGNSRFKPIIDKVNQDSAYLVLPNWIHTVIQKAKIENRVLFFDDRQLSAWTSNTSPDAARGYIGLTAYKALAYCIHLGYDAIYILGMDSSEFQLLASDEQNRLLLGGNYAYKDESNSKDLSSHFLDGFAGAFMMYSHTSGDLEKFSGPVFNLDASSFITRFPKVSDHHWVID